MTRIKFDAHIFETEHDVQVPSGFQANSSQCWLMRSLDDAFLL
ncbi:MAG: hypothetical protein WBI40_10465 [Methylococcaceae bacterium]